MKFAVSNQKKRKKIFEEWKYQWRSLHKMDIAMNDLLSKCFY